MDPLKIRISVAIAEGNYSVPYRFEIERTLLEHSKDEIASKLEGAVEIIVDELDHASFLKKNLEERAPALLTTSAESSDLSKDEI